MNSDKSTLPVARAVALDLLEQVLGRVQSWVAETLRIPGITEASTFEELLEAAHPTNSSSYVDYLLESGDLPPEEFSVGLALDIMVDLVFLRDARQRSDTDRATRRQDSDKTRPGTNLSLLATVR